MQTLRVIARLGQPSRALSLTPNPSSIAAYRPGSLAAHESGYCSGKGDRVDRLVDSIRVLDVLYEELVCPSCIYFPL